MELIAAGVMLSGYTLVWYGREMLRGCRPVWSELLVPGRYVGCHDATGGDKKHRDTSSSSPPAVKAKAGDFGGGGASGAW